LEPALARYRLGWFPMPLAGGYGWFLPARRAVLVIGVDQPRVTRSTRKAGRRLEVRIARDPLEVAELCRTHPRPGGWIDAGLVALYRACAEVGACLGVEARDPSGALVGGLFGIALGELLVGESMVSLSANASKVALAALAASATLAGLRVIDGQWPTPHLASLGFRAIDRDGFDRLRATLRLDPGSGFRPGAVLSRVAGDSAGAMPPAAG
jgi:leucyl/phenylalanyl-tRNA--protein transferase